MHQAKRGLVGFVRWALCAPLALCACMSSPVISGEELTAKGGGLDLAIYGTAFASFDVLLVVDDSLSMQDKRSILAHAVAPILFEPRASGHEPEGFPEAFRSPLPPGTHIGVISTSLSAGGISQCADRNARAHLQPLPDDEGDFLITGLGQEEADGDRLRAILDSMEDSGCGYESPLEAAYRFLVDPAPPARTTVEEANGTFTTSSSGVDTLLLQQREAFLRPTSALAVLVLTDEDDCSVLDSGEGFRAGLDSEMPRASSECHTDSGSPCCRSCGDTAPTPEGCDDLTSDAECQLGPLSEEENDPNLRCFDAKRRFGVDFLFPIERYVQGFRDRQIEDREGRRVDNPLFAAGRDPKRVFFGAIVGVPWQLLATEASIGDGGELQFLSAQELTETARWSTLVGARADPHLRPAIAPRAGLPSPASARWMDPWNSHEYDNPFKADLQYSCVFPLHVPRTCEDDDLGCDCALRSRGDQLVPDSPNNPLCQAEDGTYGQVQYFAKAYPPPRILELMRELGDRAQLGSVCPKTLDPERAAQPAQGYRAALQQAILEPFRGLSPDTCFPLLENRGLDDARCRMIEVYEQGPTGCDLPGRAPLSEKVEATIRKRHPDRTAERSLCELLRAAGDRDDRSSPAHACENDNHLPEDFAGYCIIRNEDSAVERSCGEGRRLRVAPADLLRTLGNGETLLLQVCAVE